MRALALLLVLTLAAPAAARRVRVGDALCVSQSDGPFLALAPEARDAYLTALAEAGWRLMRIDFTWSRIEPAPGRLDFAPYDDLAARAAAHGVRLLGLLDYGNPWASSAAPPGDDRYPPNDPATFARFAAAAARHFRGRVPAWEIWNEPNNFLSGFWKPAPDPARYAPLAALAARAIRRADRGARIVTGGLAPTFDFLVYGDDWGFIGAATTADRGWLRPFDAAALHPYTFFQAPPPEDESHLPAGPSVVHQMADFRDRLGEAHAARLPLWLTEIGWHTAPDSGTPLFPPGVSELDQARFLVRSTALALSERAERVCWYTVLDYPNELHDKEAAFGLFRYQAAPGVLDPKPAYAAATVFARVLGRTRFVRDLRGELGLPPEAYALCFRSGRPRQTIIVLWATAEGVPVTTRATGHVQRARLVSIDGVETDVALPAITLTLGPSPVYLVLEEGNP